MSTCRKVGLPLSAIVFSLLGSWSLAQEPKEREALPTHAIARLGSERLRHAGNIRCLAFSPDGKALVSAGQDYRIRVWDPATGKRIREHKVGDLGQQVALSPDGTFLAAAFHEIDGPASIFTPVFRLWEVATGKALPWPEKPVGLYSALAFSPDSKTLATAEREGNGTVIRLWDVPAGKEIRQFKGQQPFSSILAFSPDGKHLLSAGGKDWTLCIWKVAAAELVRSSRVNSEVRAVAFSPDGGTFATVGVGGLSLWETTTGDRVREFKGHEGAVLSVAFAPDGKTLVSNGFDGTLRLWEASTGREIRRLAGRPGGGFTLTFSPDGRTVALGGSDQSVRLWDVATGRELYPDEFHHGFLSSLTFSPDGKTLASGSSDRVICLWDVAGRKLLRRLEGHTGIVGKMTFSRDGKTLASVSAAPDRAVRLWDTTTGKELRQFTADHQGGFGSVAFSADGTRLAAVGFDGVARVWDTKAGKQIGTFKDSSSECVLFSADGELLISAGRAGFTQVRSIKSGVEAHRVKNEGGFRFAVSVSGDGRTLAIQGDDGMVSVRELVTGKERTRFKHEGLAWSLSFSPDGERLIGSMGDYSLCVWDLATGKEIGQFAGHSNLARSLTCSPDGKTLASGGSDGTILLWDLSRLPEPRRPVPRELTPKELDAEWQALGGEDAARSYRALWELRAVPRQALPLLKEHLAPAAAVDRERIAQLVKDLDSEKPAVREKATAELEKLGTAARAALLKALEGNPSADMRLRVHVLLKKSEISPLGAERLRTLRRLELLERIGTAEARELLKTLAENESDVWLAQEAKAAEARLRHRESGKP